MTTGAGLYISPTEKDTGVQNRVIQQLIEGRSNAVGSFTLNASSTTTSVAATNCAPTSVIIPLPVSSTSAADLPLMAITAGNGLFTIAHASNATSTRSFLYVIQG